MCRLFLNVYVVRRLFMLKFLYHVEEFMSSITLIGCRWLNLYEARVSRIIIIFFKPKISLEVRGL